MKCSAHRLLVAVPAALCGLLALAGAAGASRLEGRWQGHAPIPGAPLMLVLDIQSRTGAIPRVWITLPGHSVKGLPLPASLTGETTLRVDTSPVWARYGEAKPAPAITLAAAGGLAPAGEPRLQGQWQQAGHTVPLALTRTGAAQPEPPFRNTPLMAALHGRWRGAYEVNGLRRDVTLVLGANEAQMHIVRAAGPSGQTSRKTDVRFDHITQGDAFLALEASSNGFRIEGRWRAESGLIEATFLQGPFEIPLTLRREGS